MIELPTPANVSDRLFLMAAINQYVEVGVASLSFTARVAEAWAQLNDEQRANVLARYMIYRLSK